jgi:AAA family ATP:ADP antiporter
MESPPRFDARLIAALACAAGVGAQFVAGKATRDALYLANLDITTLPSMVIATAVVSLLLVAASSKALNRRAPQIVIPAIFAAHAVLLLVEWGLTSAAPVWASRAVYLQISGIGPMLGSGFWLIVTERFDPRTARERFGQITAVGTLSGMLAALAGARLAALFGVASMLPVLAAISGFSAWQIRRLATMTQAGSSHSAQGRDSHPPTRPLQSPLRVVTQSPYVRSLAMLVLVGTVSATLVDYAFKLQAVAALGQGAALMRFFSFYYGATSLVAFLVQAGSTSVVLQKFGLGIATSSSSVALLAGSAGALVMPAFPAIVAARGAESVARGSLYRAAYELLYTPLLSSEKRAAKAVVDVGCDRLGDAVGAGVLSLVLFLNPTNQYRTILLLTLACCVGSLAIARRVSRGYVDTLVQRMRSGVIDLDPRDSIDMTTRTILLRTQTAAPLRDEHGNEELEAIAALRSGDPERISRVLQVEKGLSAALVPHVIALLTADALAEDAMRALRKVADRHAGAMSDALTDGDQPFKIRRRLARVLGAGRTQRAADGLMVALNDLRFEVRYQSARSLASLAQHNRSIRIDAVRVTEAVRSEVMRGESAWESRRLVDRSDADADGRASLGLEHVFRLLSLVAPAASLQEAFQKLCSEDPFMRGTALEYLDAVLPPDIRTFLWPFLEAFVARARNTPAFGA